MKANTTPFDRASKKPICMGLTCWLWQRRAPVITKLAQRLGVTLEITQHIHGLRREIDCQASGENVDQFIGEFMRRF